MSQLVKKIRTDQGDLQIDYNALANLPTISNPNLLINSDFRNPINQRDKISYSIPDNTYTIDRWKVLSKKATLYVNDGYIKLSSISGPSYFIQKGENIPINDYITVSINAKSLTGVLNVYVGSESIEEHFSIYSAGITTYTTTVKFPDFIQLNIEAIGDASVELYWAKVEQGTVATPFVPRLYGEELMLCQRYAYAWKPIDHYTLAYHIFKSNSNSINFSVQLPFVMRVSPSLSVLGGGVSCVYNDNFNETYGSTSIEMDIANNYTAKVKANFGITFRTGDPVEFFAYSSLGLLFDAEIY